jgi:hypothetical protein
MVAVTALGAAFQEQMGACRHYRYDVGQKFDWHIDGCFEQPTGERSFFTFMVYLNEEFKRGRYIIRDRPELHFD